MTIHLQEDEFLVPSHQLKNVTVLSALERALCHAVAVHISDQLDKRALAYKPLGAPQKDDSPTIVQRASKAVRLELVIPEAIGGGLVVLPKKHDDVFCRERKETRFYIRTTPEKIKTLIKIYIMRDSKGI